MSYIIKEIIDADHKREVATLVLRDLPEWFGIEESTKHYIDTVVNYPMFVAYDDKNPIGFYSLREENKTVLEMYVLGVLKKYHNMGVGSLLQKKVEVYARNMNYSYLMVLTLAEKKKNSEYLLTRKFYLKMKFEDFYQNDDIFDSLNPCQIMIKNI